MVFGSFSQGGQTSLENGGRLEETGLGTTRTAPKGNVPQPKKAGTGFLVLFVDNAVVVVVCLLYYTY